MKPRINVNLASLFRKTTSVRISWVVVIIHGTVWSQTIDHNHQLPYVGSVSMAPQALIIGGISKNHVIGMMHRLKEVASSRLTTATLYHQGLYAVIAELKRQSTVNKYPHYVSKYVGPIGLSMKILVHMPIIGMIKKNLKPCKHLGDTLLKLLC